MCEIIPIGTTAIDWTSLSRIYTEVLCEDIKGRLDGTYIRQEHPTAIISCLDIHATNAITAMQRPTVYWQHCPLTVLFITKNQDILLALSLFITLTIENKGKKYVAIGTATLDKWFQCMTYLNHIDRDSEVRSVGNRLVNLLEHTALKETFNKQMKITVKDGTYAWRQ